MSQMKYLIAWDYKYMYDQLFSADVIPHGHVQHGTNRFFPISLLNINKKLLKYVSRPSQKKHKKFFPSHYNVNHII